MMRLGWAVGMLALVASGCGTQTGSPQSGDTPGAGEVPEAATPTVTTTGGPVSSGTGLEAPPPYRLRYDEQELVLGPHTWCYASGCVDGFSQNPPSVGSPAAIRIHVPVSDWALVATFTPADQRCGRRQSVEPVKQGGWYTLRPPGRAGRYDVELFAHGDGDMVGSFEWVTPVDGELPTPQSRLALIADHDGHPDSYGVELLLENLAETPDSAHARITVTSANGRSLTFQATRAEQRCWPEGTVYFDGPDREGKTAAALGDMPFHYTVTVTIDGRRYSASADYPADEIRGNEPSVALEFSPALPALR